MSLLDNLMGAVGGHGGGDLSGLVETIASQGAAGGVSGLVEAFQKGGLGEIAQSWVSTGANHPISAEQIQAVLGSGAIGQFAEKLGVDPQVGAAKLAELLPGLVDRLTPGGQLPTEGLGGAVGDLLGGFLKT
jgi:uncharacterized protein YidB (DUF937 family)